MSAPKVTVLMAVYNAEKYLRQAIESILNQTFTDFELLIVDDGSSDSSPEIIRSYQDPRIRVIRNSTNRGIAYSRKKALELARGEYVAVLDADDVALRERLQVQAEYLDANADVQLIGSAYEVIDENGNVVRTCTVPTDPLTIRWKLLFGNCIAHSTAMFRRVTALEVGGYDERMTLAEDFDLYIRINKHGQIAQLDRPLVQWRRHARGLWEGASAEAQDCSVIETVVKSIYLQTGRDIDSNVARCLARNTRKSAPTRTVVRETYATIMNCLDRVQASVKMARRERKHLVTLAVEDIFRIAHDTPDSYRDACRAAVLCAAKYDLCRLLDRRFVRVILVSILPCRTVDILRSIKHLLCPALFFLRAWGTRQVVGVTSGKEISDENHNRQHF